MDDVVRRKSAGPGRGRREARPWSGGIRALQPEEESRCRPAAEAAGRHIANNQKAQDSILLNWAYL